MPILDRFSRQIPPRNNGSPNIARSAIDQIQRSAAQQYENALSVNARPVLYFAKKLSGIRCTCAYGVHQSALAAAVPDGPVVSALPDGFGSQDFIESAVSGTAFSINRYGARPNDPNFTPPPQAATALASQQSTTDLSDPLRANVDAGETDDFFAAPTGDNLFNEAPKACGVCMNTGFVGGYDPYNMQRHVYDTQADWSNVVPEQTERPNAFSQAGSPSVVVLIPRGARNLLTLRIWNNRNVVKGATLLYGTTLFTQSWQSLRGQRVSLTLSFNDRMQLFTHVELMWDIGMPPIMVEWAKLEYAENLDVIDQINDVQVIVSPRVPTVALYDIIVEDVFNRSWKITDVNTNFDREKHVGGWGASVRVLQRYEIYNLLPHMQLRTYNWANQTITPLQNVPGIAPVEPFSAGQQTPFR